MRGKKRRNYISRQACFVIRFTLQGFKIKGIKPLKSEAIHEAGLSGYVVASFFSSHNIYSALLQRIEHSSTRKSTCRLPIYIYIYIYSYKGTLFIFRQRTSAMKTKKFNY